MEDEEEEPCEDCVNRRNLLTGFHTRSLGRELLPNFLGMLGLHTYLRIYGSQYFGNNERKMIHCLNNNPRANKIKKIFFTKDLITGDHYGGDDVKVKVLFLDSNKNTVMEFLITWSCNQVGYSYQNFFDDNFDDSVEFWTDYYDEDAGKIFYTRTTPEDVFRSNW